MTATVSLSQHDWSLHRKGPIDQARHNERVKEAIKDSLGETRDRTYLHLLTDLGWAEDDAGRPRQALVSYGRAVTLMERTGRTELLGYAMVQHDRAMVLVRAGERAEAEPGAREKMGRSPITQKSWLLCSQELRTTKVRVGGPGG